MKQINQFIETLFETGNYVFDASILENPERYEIKQVNERRTLFVEKISKQAQDILSGKYEVQRGLCHQISYTVLKKLLETRLILGGKVYTGFDPDERYKNHSLLVVELQNGETGIVDIALDVDSCIPTDGQKHESRHLLKERIYRAYFDSEKTLYFEIFIPEKGKSLVYEMRETTDDIFYKSVLYSFQNSQRGLVKTVRTKVGDKYDTSIEFLPLGEKINALIRQGKNTQVSYF